MASGGTQKKYTSKTETFRFTFLVQIPKFPKKGIGSQKQAVCLLFKY